MHFDMKKKLKTVSVAHIKLHRQFFYALVAQIIGPTLFLILPAAPILAYPIIYAFINYKISWKTGWILPPIGLYPAFDSVAYMLIVTEYKEVITRNDSRFPFFLLGTANTQKLDVSDIVVYISRQSDMIPFGVTGALTKIGFCISFLANFFLIYLTVFHVKKLQGTYKRMIIYFAFSGILFSGLELLARPFAHNYNGSLLFFSASTLNISQDFLQLAISIWAGFYLHIVSFITVQFFYRYLCLFNATNIRLFDGFWTILWILYPIIIGAIYSVAFFTLSFPDEYADEYVRSDILNNYGMSINTVPRFIVVPYDVDGLLRMKNLIFLAIGVSMISFHYSIMLFCGLKMHFNMKKELKKFSAPQRKLQRQFFYALVAQSLGPTIFLVLPATPILLSPLMPPQLEISISWQTGYLYTLVGLYPPFDSIAFMTIVTEYKKVIKKKVAELVSSNQDATHSISNRVQLKRI